jgi:non-ribosomal peptide synthetase component E (peptide arylation enzyme)
MAGIALSQKLGNSMGVVPYTLIVNQQGQIIYQQGGELSKDELVDVITPLVK